MALAALDKGKGKARLEDLEDEEIDQNEVEGSESSSSSDSDSDSDSSDSDSDSDSEDDISPDVLDSLLAKARQNARAKALQPAGAAEGEEEFIRLGGDDEDEAKEEPPLPPLDTGSLPQPYIELSEDRGAGPSKIRDPDIEAVQKAASTITAPAVPAPPTQTTKDGKRLTKKELKNMKNQTAGKAWFDLPAPPESELPRLYREVEALRLHKQLDPKQFYRKEPGEGKGIKGLPKHFAIGTIIPSNSPFGGPNADNLPRTARKRTLVDELVDDAEARSYAKKKFKELQTVRGARGRGTLAAKQALRKPKW
ncbi:Fcf2-domain-containing protein [Lentinus brumalis]|uniref:Fcf2-domain-containing protein n=1 Tax=Lentinus brumalis TaxID=2498619 RepID=A0A371DCJ7_9APHY|nr:Fcf2-domain-containing protein [Polyporus brumalis]